MAETTRNVLRRIEDLANDAAKDYTNLHLRPRGTPIFIDQTLRGTIRFARRQGNFLPVIAAENSTELSAAVTPPTNRLTLDRVLPAFTTLGAVLNIGPDRELATIADIDTTTGEVTTEQELNGTHAAGTTVDLYGIPVTMIGPEAEGATVIQIRSSTPVMIGDQIAVDTTAGVLSSTVATVVTNAQFLGTTISGLNNYELTLAAGITRSFVTDEALLLRAQPAYQSQIESIRRVNGPFVLDYVSGPFFDDLTIDEYLNVQLLDALGVPLPGFTNPVGIGKNFPIVAMPIRADSLLFWDVIQGEVQWRDNRMLAVTDALGRFVLSTELVPAWPPGQEWEIPLRADDPCQLRVGFLPTGYRTIALATGVIDRLTVGTGPATSPTTRLEIVVNAQRAGTIVEINNWLPVTSVTSLQYQLTSTAYGSNVWQSASATVKPYFFTLDDIKARYDFTGYNKGVVNL
jgi:hypothetical protein